MTKSINSNEMDDSSDEEDLFEDAPKELVKKC